MRPAVIASLVLAAACASNPAPVPVVAGSSGDLNRLAGEWVGEYSSTQTGRSGSITFRLAGGTDSAWGDVVMIPAGHHEPVQPMAITGADGRTVMPASQLLTIRFVQVVGGTVSGALDQYRDPECGCGVYTTFSGRLSNGVIEGEFASRHSSHPGTWTGRWQVRRR